MNRPKKNIYVNPPSEAVEPKSESPVGSGLRFSMVPWEVGTDPRLTHVDARIYFVLAGCRRGDAVKLGTRLLAKYSCTSQRRVVEALKRLKECGYLESASGRLGQRSVYRLIAPLFDAIKDEKSGPEAIASRDMAAFECPECHHTRPGLCKSGVCRSCNLRRKLRVIVREEVVAEIERTA